MRFTSTTTARAVAVAAEQVDRTDVGGVLAPYEPQPVAQRDDAAGR